MRFSWTEHTSDEEVLRRAGMERGLLKSIRKRQMEFFGHVMRREGLEHLAVTGKIERKKGRRRPRVGYWLDGVQRRLCCLLLLQNLLDTHCSCVSSSLEQDQDQLQLCPQRRKFVFKVSWL